MKNTGHYSHCPATKAIAHCWARCRHLIVCKEIFPFSDLICAVPPSLLFHLLHPTVTCHDLAEKFGGISLGGTYSLYLTSVQHGRSPSTPICPCHSAVCHLPN